GLFYNLMATLSLEHIIVTSVAQTITILFAFFGLGLEHGASVMAGNMIGARKLNEVKSVLIAGLQLIFIFTSLMVVIFLLFPHFLVESFFNNPEALETNLQSSLSLETVTHAKILIEQSLLWIAGYL